MIVVQGLLEGGPPVVVWFKLSIDLGFHGINYAVEGLLSVLSGGSRLRGRCFVSCPLGGGPDDELEGD